MEQNFHIFRGFAFINKNFNPQRLKNIGAVMSFSYISVKILIHENPFSVHLRKFCLAKISGSTVLMYRKGGKFDGVKITIKLCYTKYMLKSINGWSTTWVVKYFALVAQCTCTSVHRIGYHAFMLQVIRIKGTAT